MSSLLAFVVAYEELVAAEVAAFTVSGEAKKSPPGRI